jgi:hypothetical protein
MVAHNRAMVSPMKPQKDTSAMAHHIQSIVLPLAGIWGHSKANWVPVHLPTDLSRSLHLARAGLADRDPRPHLGFGIDPLTMSPAPGSIGALKHEGQGGRLYERKLSSVSSPITKSIRAFIDAHIASFEKLDLLIALQRASDRGATVRELMDTMNITRDEMNDLLRELVAEGLVIEAEESFTLQPRESDESTLTELLRVYESNKALLVTAIAESAMDRLRTLAGRAFADAFVIRKKPGGDHG